MKSADFQERIKQLLKATLMDMPLSTTTGLDSTAEKQHGMDIVI